MCLCVLLVPASAAAGAAGGAIATAAAAAAGGAVQSGRLYEIAFFGSQPQVKLVKNKTDPMKFDPPHPLAQLDLMGDTVCFESAVRESGVDLSPGAVWFNQAGTKTELGNLFRDGCKVGMTSHIALLSPPVRRQTCRVFWFHCIALHAFVSVIA